MENTVTMEMLKARPLSFSSLIAFKQSPLHYIYYLNNRRAATPAMAIGSLIDRMLFNPEDFDENGMPKENTRYIIQPDFSKGEGIRAIAKKWKEDNAGKTWVTLDMITESIKIVSAVNNNPISKEKIMQVTSVQKKVEWTDKETGLPMIGYLDMEAPTFISDLKSTPSAHPEDFIKSCMNFDYHIQAAIYLDAAAHRGLHPDFFHIAVEKEAPYGVSVLKASKEFIKLGMQEYKKLLTEFKYCMEQKAFDQSYEFRATVGYYQLDLPGWALHKLDK